MRPAQMPCPDCQVVEDGRPSHVVDRQLPDAHAMFRQAFELTPLPAHRREVVHCPDAGIATDLPALLEIVRYLDLSGPLLDFAMDQGFIDCDTKPENWATGLAIATDRALELGHPVDDAGEDDTHSWLDDPGLWAEVHAWRKPGQRVQYHSEFPGRFDRVID